MKKFLTAVAVAATIMSASAAQATERAEGHWEWRVQSQHGPRSTHPAFRQVWVSDALATNADAADMAPCDACPSSHEQPRPHSHRG